jgi:hypothetical protein
VTCIASWQELIQHTEVVKEADLKKAITNTYKRKKAFKRLSHADQDRAGRKLVETGDSAAAFFDLNALRQTSSKRRNSKVSGIMQAVNGQPLPRAERLLLALRQTSSTACWQAAQLSSEDARGIIRGCACCNVFDWLVAVHVSRPSLCPSHCCCDDTNCGTAAWPTLHDTTRCLSATASWPYGPQEEAAEAVPDACCCCVWFNKLAEWVDEMLWRKLYALIFATSFWSPSLFRMHR